MHNNYLLLVVAGVLHIPHPPGIGRPPEVTKRTQKLKATVCLAENFPLDLHDQVRPIIDLMVGGGGVGGGGWGTLTLGGGGGRSQANSTCTCTVASTFTFQFGLAKVSHL